MPTDVELDATPDEEVNELPVVATDPEVLVGCDDVLPEVEPTMPPLVDAEVDPPAGIDRDEDEAEGWGLEEGLGSTVPVQSIRGVSESALGRLTTRNRRAGPGPAFSVRTMA